MTDNKAPERIWAAPPDIFDGVSIWQDAPDPPGNFPAYIHDDLHLAMVAAAYEVAWRAAFQACKTAEAGYVDENSRLAQRIENEMRLAVAGAIKRCTPADARAALDRLIAEAEQRGAERAMAQGVRKMSLDEFEERFDPDVRARKDTTHD